jgi:hypothetical protein
MRSSDLIRRLVLACQLAVLAQLGGCLLPDAKRDERATGADAGTIDAGTQNKQRDAAASGKPNDDGESSAPEPAPPTEHVFAEWPMPDALPGSQTKPSYASTDTIIIDKVTGLRWQSRPPEIYGPCTGKYRVDGATGSGCTWAEAVAYCRTSELGLALGGGIWRLPTKIELESILDETRVFAIYPLFDTYPIDFFWTASPYIKPTTGGLQLAWAVDFAEGWTYNSSRIKAGRVRCVTSDDAVGGGGPQYSLEDEVVTDERTRLVWQRVAASTQHTWVEAIAYCKALEVAGGGWRLPALKELLTLVDPRRRDPAIDTTAFPDTPESVFWTASPFLDETQQAFQIDFRDGSSQKFGSVEDRHHARCVR